VIEIREPRAAAKREVLRAATTYMSIY